MDKSQWKDILVFAEFSGGRLHPVSLELIGKAQELAKGAKDFVVKAVLLGDGVAEQAQELCHYGIDEVAVYDDPALSFFRTDVFACCIEDYIRACRPSVVLIGATSLGRSLAPRLSTRFHTGLTADCTRLEMRENTDLVQIRPAFGGNIMAQIVTPYTRPQFATVRYKVMDGPVRNSQAQGRIVARPLPKQAAASGVSHVSTMPVSSEKPFLMRKSWSLADAACKKKRIWRWSKRLQAFWAATGLFRARWSKKAGPRMPGRLALADAPCVRASSSPAASAGPFSSPPA